MLRAVIFDFDYTLGDTTDGIVGAFNYAFREMSLPIQPTGAIRATVGLTLHEAFRILTGDGDEAAADRFIELFQLAAPRTLVPSASLYPRTLETIRFFRRLGCRLGIVTTKRRMHIVSIFNKFGITDEFDIIVGEDNVINKKPDPEGLLFALETLGVTGDAVATDALYVGDSFVDGETAARARVPFAAVLTGTTSRKRLLKYSPLTVADEIGGVADYIKCTEWN